jgi:hypothetical protein
VAFAPRGSIQARGAGAVLARLQDGDGTEAAPAALTRDRLREALSACLSSHLVQDGGVAGLREIPGSPRLSPSAGAGAAVLVRRLFPGDERLAELALRLADFALKGQHPSGMFFTAFDARAGAWQGVSGKPGAALLSVADAAWTADSLLALADDLEQAGLPHGKYRVAGLRFVESFADEKQRLRMPGSLHAPGSSEPSEQGPGGMALFLPLARVHGATRRDRHRKPLDELARAFSALPWDSFAPLSSRAGRDPDAEASLLSARLFIEMRRHGYRPVEPTGGSAAVQKKRASEAVRLFAQLLVPWIRVRRAGSEGTGMLTDSFTRQRLLPARLETAWLLLALRSLGPDPDLAGTLRRLALLCMQATGSPAIGTSWMRRADGDPEGKPGQRGGQVHRPSAGPVDSRRLVREVDCGLRILQEFPRA